MDDASTWIGQAIDYHNDLELASIITEVDEEFERATGSTFDHAVAESPHDAEWAHQWLKLLQDTAEFQVKWWMDHDDLDMPTPDLIRPYVEAVDPSKADTVTAWFAAQLDACHDAVQRWRFATAAQIKNDYTTTVTTWREAWVKKVEP